MAGTVRAGFANREGIQAVVQDLDGESGAKLRNASRPVVVIDCGTVEIFEAVE